MISISSLFVFLGASVLVTIVPGPDNVFVIAQGVSNGRKAAVLTALGMVSGITIHTMAAALGISAIIYSSSVAFHLLKFTGAAYLFYLAFLTYKERERGIAFKADGLDESSFEMLKRGFLMNVLNPKVGIFFLAFIPQFVDPNSSHQSWLMLQLGIVFMIQALGIFSAIAYFAGGIGSVLQRNGRMRSSLSIAAALTFVLIGLRLVIGH